MKRRLATFVVEDPAAMLWGGERIFRDGKLIGSTTSGYYGFTLGRAIALGYVRHDEAITPEFITSGKYDDRFRRKTIPGQSHCSSRPTIQRTSESCAELGQAPTGISAAGSILTTANARLRSFLLLNGTN